MVQHVQLFHAHQYYLNIFAVQTQIVCGKYLKINVLNLQIALIYKEVVILSVLSNQLIVKFNKLEKHKIQQGLVKPQTQILPNVHLLIIHK